jgi:BASS family bile acid:Na+ symporter
MIDHVINILVTITLIEMMMAIGLGVTWADLIGVAGNWRLVLQAGLANYVCVPAVTFGLVILFHPADPLVSAGFLILAVCPGAPFGPPCARIAHGNMAVAVGMMVLLAGSSAIAAPVLLHWLLPLMSGEEALQVDVVKIVSALLLTQLLPLCVGLGVRQWWPGLAERLLKPANLVSSLLGLSVVGLILAVQYHLLTEIAWRGWSGMFALLVATCGSGWLLGGPGIDNRRTLALTTSLRNVGVGLVIAAGNFAGTAAVTATLAYGIFEIIGSLLLAMAWGRLGAAVSSNPETIKSSPLKSGQNK